MRLLKKMESEISKTIKQRGGSDMKNKNAEGYPDPTATKAIKRADRPPESVRNARRAIKVICEICHVRILGKITTIDERGRRW